MPEPNWDALRCFISVCQHGSLTGAAAELNTSIATLARRMDALEASLGLKLLRRGPSGAAITPDGKAILAACKPGGMLLAQVARTARALQDAPQATPIRISSTEPMVANILAPHLPLFLQANPNARLELEASTDISNLNVGASDIAVRMVKPAAETLVGRQLPAISLSLYCSEGYLRGREPAALALSDECLMLYDSAYGPIAENVWAKSLGLNTAARIRSSSVQTLMQAALAGAGIALLPDFLARHTPLVIVPAPTAPARNPWLVFHRDTRNQASMKAVRNWIVEAFKHTLTPQPTSNGTPAQELSVQGPSLRKL